MWRTVSFLAAQASLAGCSEARMSTIPTFAVGSDFHLTFGFPAG
jgi:hypothetical protein